MKVFDLIFKALLSFITIVILTFWFTGIGSAFEADRACHVLLAEYATKSDDLGCDHDTETHQWILYKNIKDSYDAEIIKKFRYRFL